MPIPRKRHSDSRLGSKWIQQILLYRNLQTCCIYLVFSPDLLCRKYPKINLKLRAPLELENLLPYNLEYRIYDKNTNQNWRSYLRKGGVMPVHSVELGHFILLNVTVEDTGQLISSLFDPDSYYLLFQFSNQVNLRLSTQMDIRTLT